MDSSMEVSSRPEVRNNGSTAHNQIITRSDHYPTTFVQADTSSFKQVVQMLTGSPETAKQDPPPAPASSKGNFEIPPKRPNNSFKLYERRQSNSSNRLMINTLMINGGSNNNNYSPRFSPRNLEVLSPSCLDFPRLALNSPVTPLDEESNSSSEEERAILEKGFYLHPSPLSTPRDSEPRLLPLFPETSPRVSSDS